MTSLPIDTGADYALSTDVNVTNIQWFRNTNCSGTPYQTIDSMPNDGCVVVGVGLGVARALSCRKSSGKSVQWVAAWAGAPDCPRSTSAGNQKETFNGVRMSNSGECITLFLSGNPFGSVRFTCPKASAVSSSSTSVSQLVVSSTGSSGTIPSNPISSSTGGSEPVGPGTIDSSTGTNGQHLASTGNDPFSSASEHIPSTIIFLTLSYIIFLVASTL